MLQHILKTDQSYSGTFLRLALALTILPHGFQKITDFSNILGILENYYGIPSFIGLFVILIEFFSPILLIFGFFTRINAGLLGIVLLGAGFFHLENGFYINWLGQQSGEGYQFHLLYCLTAMTSVILGSGNLALDSTLLKKIKKQTT